MTIVVGLKTLEGAILAADCLWKGSSEFLRNKINPGIYINEFSRDESCENGMTGAYIASAGYFCICDVSIATFIPFLSKRPNMSDLLTDKIVLENSRDEFNNKIDEIERILKRRIDLKIPQDKVNELYDMVRKLEELREVRCFIESTSRAAISGLNRVIVRLSENYTPDLIKISEGRLEVVDSCSIGSGKKYFEDLAKIKNVKTNYEGLVIVSSIMNKALESGEYKGYSLVAVRKEENRNISKTAYEPKAVFLDLESIKWGDYRFRDAD